MSSPTSATSFQMPDDAKEPTTLAEQLLDENPFKSLQARDPDRYKSLHDRIIQAMGNRASLPDVESLPTADVAPLSLAYLSRASDALAVEFTEAFEAYLVKVRPEELRRMLFHLLSRKGAGRLR